MTAQTKLATLIKEMSPVLNKGEYVYVTVDDLSQIDRQETLCEFKEKESTTIIIERKKADELRLNYDYIASWITLNIHSSLEAVGLTAIVSAELSQNNISCNIVAAYYHDHIFVNKKDTTKAVQVLENLSKNYK